MYVDMTLDEYIQLIKKSISRDCLLKQEDCERAYEEYCELKGRKTPDVYRVNLLKTPFFISNSNTRGYFSQFWLILSDLNKYLLKELPNGKFFKDKLGTYTRTNAIVIPKLIQAAGLDTAEYYIVSWIMDDSVSTWEDDFLLTPSFLKNGDELINFKDILGEESLDVEIIEKTLRKELELRHFDKNNIESFIQDLRKKICMSEIIDNSDISLDNMSVIFNNGNARVAPMYDFDFCMVNESKANSHFEAKGKKGLVAVLDYYKDDINLIKWLKEKVLTIDIDKVISDMSAEPNRGLVGKKSRQAYVTFWNRQMSVIKEFLVQQHEIEHEDKEHN